MNVTEGNVTVAVITGIVITSNWWYIALSYCISVLGAFTTFQLIGEIGQTHSKTLKAACVVLSSLSMSCCCIWSMHFIGTVCYTVFTVDNFGVQNQIAKMYDPLLTVMSAFTAFVFCMVALTICSLQQYFPVLVIVPRLEYFASLRKRLAEMDLMDKQSCSRLRKILIPTRVWFLDSIIGSDKSPNIVQVITGALFAAVGILGMHYMGMYASAVPSLGMSFKPGTVVGAVILALFASTAALFIGFSQEREVTRVITAAVAGLAVCAVHYVGMSSCNYYYKHDAEVKPSGIGDVDLILIVTMATSFTCFAMLVVSSVTSSRRREVTIKAERATHDRDRLYMEKLDIMIKRIAGEEFQTRRVMELVSDAVCVIDAEGSIVKCNAPFQKLVGRSQSGGVTSNIYNLVTGLPSHNEIVNNLNTKREVIVHHAILGEISTTVTCSAEESLDATFCVLVFSANVSDMLSPVENIPSTKIDSMLSLSASALLKDQNTLNELRSLCAKEHSLENLEFIIMVDKYRNTTNIMQRVALQEVIANTFLVEGSDKQLNLPTKHMNAAVKAVGSAYGQLQLFDELEKDVLMILSDSYFRVKSSMKLVPTQTEITVIPSSV
ncbi:hypothetical protein AKO1_010211 [Acrasis kona]|uniref:PAS domain-containing protein n=1 Tax=Acrasis kona TaxID=1008807 RepID=A0AAW2ZQT6_9EUKA